ncbi:putative nucleotidyltransferase with HDIG domain [Sporomusaceae bacterium BoRhaA]|uniref:HD-GYP domain-containing protein n=1 Tax=Pelorhabdus rhamnosifermentans TaxID=2772457 RepID=UPI001FE77A8B|nr:HD-GYP domain-containing protein [Pelorhabdus rhamnosifermentans]MBU2699893.1 putative nucleotidyltransferase with HDIG domain [Pelorhabdus rhamnosifermentans]
MHSKVFEKIEMKLETALFLFKAIANYDPITALHCCNTSSIAVNLAGKLHLSGRKLNDVMIAAQLHDIGKIKIPKQILNNPGKLTENEFETMKKHPEIGFSIVKDLTEFHDIAEAILYHHEKFNGGGYPTGRSSQEIPLYARILSIADAYEAMISDRIYHKALTEEKALQVISEEKGIQFDPEIVTVFIAMKSVYHV